MDDLVKLDIKDLLECIKNPELKIKDPPHKPLKDEFKKFVDKTVEERRKSSSIKAMRDFHNWVKKILISNVSNYYYSKLHSKINILDIAVGRGGDLFKWINTTNGKKVLIDKVFGFDSNEMSVKSKDPFNPGALQRLEGIDTKGIKIKFDVGNAMRPSMELLNNISSFSPKGYQIVSCQFAMHYFFKSKQDLDTVMKIVSGYLVSGGYFIGTILDETKIRNDITGNLFNLVPTNPFKPKSPYNNEYSFEILDSNDEGNYFNTMGTSTEYLVNQKEFVEVAKKYNLVPDKNFFEPYKMENKTEYTNSVSPFVSFTEILKLWKPKPGNPYMNEDELQLNSLYTTFVFKKN
jgi:mRNA (guanine-N7-)-methyltransferase